MVDEKKSKEKESPAPAPTAAAPQAPQRPVKVGGAKTSYANFARAMGSPDEVILDLALDPNAYGPVTDEEIQIDHRIVLNYTTAKRLLLVLNETVRRHEEKFGAIELDVRRRLKS